MNNDRHAEFHASSNIRLSIDAQSTMTSHCCSLSYLLLFQLPFVQFVCPLVLLTTISIVKRGLLRVKSQYLDWNESISKNKSAIFDSFKVGERHPLAENLPTHSSKYLYQLCPRLIVWRIIKSAIRSQKICSVPTLLIKTLVR